MYVYVCVSAYVCMCVCLCMRVCVCVCVYVYGYSDADVIFRWGQERGGEERRGKEGEESSFLLSSDKQLITGRRIMQHERAKAWAWA